MLYVAAALLVALAVGHSVLGERYVLRVILASDQLPVLFGRVSFTRAIVRYAWHILSILALGFAALLVLIALGASRSALLVAMGATFVVAGLFPLIQTRGRHLAWVLLIGAGALCIVAALAP